MISNYYNKSVNHEMRSKSLKPHIFHALQYTVGKDISLCHIIQNDYGVEEFNPSSTMPNKSSSKSYIVVDYVVPVTISQLSRSRQPRHVTSGWARAKAHAQPSHDDVVGSTDNLTYCDMNFVQSS